MDDLIYLGFGYTVFDIEHDVKEHGYSTILEKILSTKKQGGCRCAEKTLKVADVFPTSATWWTKSWVEQETPAYQRQCYSRKIGSGIKAHVRILPECHNASSPRHWSRLAPAKELRRERRGTTDSSS